MGNDFEIVLREIEFRQGGNVHQTGAQQLLRKSEFVFSEISN